MSKERAIEQSLYGDKLSLGPHWIYDQKELAEKFPDVSTPQNPAPDSFHQSKKAGDYTHYGDQNALLLEILEIHGYDLDKYLEAWKQLFSDYSDYVDHATQATLENLEAGKSPPGSDSEDFSVVGRIAPLLRVAGDLKDFVEKSRAVTALTHHSEVCLEASEYFARVTWAVLEGTPVLEALKQTLHVLPENLHKLGGQAIVDDRDSLKAALDYGLACSVEQCLPVTLQVLAHSSSLESAMDKTIRSGGDNAARASVVGMVFGASGN